MCPMSERKRRRGRPRLDPQDTSTDVHLRIPTREYEAVCRTAQRHDVKPTRVIRLAVRHFVTKNSLPSPSPAF